MKKITLLAAALSVGLGASALHLSHPFNSEFELSNFLTPEHATSNKGYSKANQRLSGVAVEGDAVISKVAVGKEVENVTAEDLYGQVGPDGQTLGVYTNGTENGFVRFVYNATKTYKRDASQERAMASIHSLDPRYYNAPDGIIKVYVGPLPEGVESAQVTPVLSFVGKDFTPDGEMDEFPCVHNLLFEPIELTNEMQTLELHSVALDSQWDPTQTALFINVEFYGAPEGTFLSLSGWGACSASYPVLSADSNCSWYNVFVDQDIEFAPSSIFIQAEDFDANVEGEPLHHSINCMGVQIGDSYGYYGKPGPASWWYEPGLDNFRVCSWSNGITGNPLFQDGDADFNSAVNRNPAAPAHWLPSFAVVGMTNSPGSWGGYYTGKYKEEGSNLVTWEDAQEGFGCFVEYTFDMAEDGFLDLSLSTVTHMVAWYDNVAGGTPAKDGAYATWYKQPRDENGCGGYEVEGLDDDYIKLYGYSYVVSVDGEEQRTAWTHRAMPNKRTGAMTQENGRYPHRWQEYYDLDENGDKVNSKYFYVYPAFMEWNDGMEWRPQYRWLENLRCYRGNVSAGANNEFTQYVDNPDNGVTLADYVHPDYIDIPLEKGTHTIRVRSMGGSTIFDEMMLTYKAVNSKGETYKESGIGNVMTELPVAESATEYFDLQGRRVANPQGGIFIRRQGSSVSKVVIR